MAASNSSFFLVDDDPDDTSLFRETLEETAPSIKLQTAVNGEDALQKLLSGLPSRPDLIFLDLNMPRMDGKQCLGMLRDHPDLSKIPVIMYTTSSQSRDIEEAMMMGAICFITKPSNVSDLRIILAVISRHVHGNLLQALQQLSRETSTYIIC